MADLEVTGALPGDVDQVAAPEIIEMQPAVKAGGDVSQLEGKSPRDVQAALVEMAGWLSPESADQLVYKLASLIAWYCRKTGSRRGNVTPEVPQNNEDWAQFWKHIEAQNGYDPAFVQQVGVAANFVIEIVMRHLAAGKPDDGPPHAGLVLPGMPGFGVVFTGGS